MEKSFRTTFYQAGMASAGDHCKLLMILNTRLHLQLLAISFVVKDYVCIVFWQWEPFQCNWDHTLCEKEGRVGIAVDWGSEVVICWAACCICCCRGNIFFGVICCHLLAEEARCHARTDVQQWAYQSWWGVLIFIVSIHPFVLDLFIFSRIKSYDRVSMVVN